jgi:hypothetical protein
VSGRVFSVLLLIVVFASVSFGQDIPAFEGSFGYSFLRNFNNFNRHGWVGSAAGNVNDWLGVKGEVSGNYSDSLNSTAYSFLAGPQISFRSGSALIPWAHVLVGVQRTQRSFPFFVSLPSPTTFLATANNSDFAIQPGGGVDFWLQDHFGLRLGGDWRRAFRGNGLSDSDYLRLQAGIVVRFGTKE